MEPSRKCTTVLLINIEITKKIHFQVLDGIYINVNFSSQKFPDSVINIYLKKVA